MQLKYFFKVLAIYIVSQTSMDVSAQTITNYKYPTHLLLQGADSLLCNGDTLNAVKLLEDFVNIANRNQITWKSKSDCSLISDMVSPSSIFADICLEISDLSLLLNNPENAIKYINKLKDEYSPRFGGCLNGILMYETKISIHLANYYLHKSQKDEAIKTLAEYFIYQEGYSVKATEKLKELLKDEYSKSELRTNVIGSIDNIELGANGKPEIVLFGQRIILWPTSTIQDAKEFCRTNINLNKLME